MYLVDTGFRQKGSSGDRPWTDSHTTREGAGAPDGKQGHVSPFGGTGKVGSTHESWFSTHLEVFST